MVKKIPQITELSLNKDMKELAHSFVRELAMACKKMAIYGPGHPLSRKALDKPYLVLQNCFHYKKFLNLFVQKGDLYVLNISIKDSIFHGQILQYLQLLDLSALLFERELAPSDLELAVEAIVDRKNLHDSGFQLGVFLERRNIRYIQANSEQAFSMFEDRKRYRGEIHGDFTLKRLALDQIGRDLCDLARVFSATSDELIEMGIDFDQEIVSYLIPDKVASIDAETFRSELSRLATIIKSSSVSEGESLAATDSYALLFRLVGYHPDRELIIADLDSAVERRSGRPDSVQNSTGAIKIQSQDRVDKIMDLTFMDDAAPQRTEEFADAFYRLLSTGQKDKAENVSIRLMDLMSSPEPSLRQKALGLLVAALDSLKEGPHFVFVGFLIGEVSARLQKKCETFEYSEFIWRLFDKCIKAEQFEVVVLLVETIASRREIDDGVTVYDSMAIKKACDEISRPSLVEFLVSKLVSADGDISRVLKRILVAIGSEEVALGLASIISHPLRNVRQQSLKILSELGKASLKVFTDILVNDSYFSREPGRHELPNAKWYVIRNSIFVLGSLADPGGVMPLRLRISDPDVRVRREIISSLEKIGDDEALDCLVFMAEDVDREIRKAAIVAIGHVGTEDSAPLLIDITGSSGSESITIIAALGKLGGKSACDFLRSLLSDTDKLTRLTEGKVSRDELRVSIVKALSQIGKPEAIDEIRVFKENLSTAQKLLFKNSPLQKTISEVLSRSQT